MGSDAAETEWGWFVGVATATLPYLCGISLDEFYLSPRQCVRAFGEGRRKVRELFGDDITMPEVHCPPLSYGHIACLGARVIFPRDSEPSVRPIYSGIDDAVKELEKPVRFEENDLFRHYISVYRYLEKEFARENVKFSGFGYEGPITSAVLLRGKDFCVDLYRSPQKVKRLLDLLTESIISFVRFTRGINSEPEMNPESTGLADDFSSLIHPKMWREFVVPYWDRYYAALTSGKRTLHCENLSPDHLAYLDEAGIDHYDPSVSARLDPQVINERTNVPFTWRLPSFELMKMSITEVPMWVRRSADKGARHVHLYIEPLMCEHDNPLKVLAFIDAAKEMARLPDVGGDG